MGSVAYGFTWFPFINGVWNPYYGGFGHFNLPFSGAGYAYPGFQFPLLPPNTIVPGL